MATGCPFLSLAMSRSTGDMGAQIHTGLAYRLMALMALTTPPVPRLRRTLPVLLSSKVRGPRFDAMISERLANNSRTSSLSRRFLCLSVSSAVLDSAIALSASPVSPFFMPHAKLLMANIYGIGCSKRYRCDNVRSAPFPLSLSSSASTAFLNEYWSGLSTPAWSGRPAGSSAYGCRLPDFADRARAILPRFTRGPRGCMS